jgi:hypothetical protein
MTARSSGAVTMRKLVSVAAFSMVIFLMKMSAGEAQDREAEGLSSTAIMSTTSYCGIEPIRQEKNASGDCNRLGVFRSYKVQKLNGVPVRKWSVRGSVSNLEIATGCYCVIDE